MKNWTEHTAAKRTKVADTLADEVRRPEETVHHCELHILRVRFRKLFLSVGRVQRYVAFDGEAYLQLMQRGMREDSNLDVNEDHHVFQKWFVVAGGQGLWG